MMILGWCTKCKRIRQVSVRVPVTKGINIGVCRDCGGS